MKTQFQFIASCSEGSALREKNEKTTVILVRHGESEGNEKALFRGRKDFPLTERGQRQARDLALALKSFNLTQIFSSPLERATATAAAISDVMQQPVRTVQGFTNMALGPWEGRHKDEVSQDYPEEWELWLKNPERLHLPKAETLDQVQSRAFSNLQHLISRHRGETFAVVTHRTVLKPLLAACLSIAEPYFWRLHFDTASYSVLTFDGQRQFTLVTLNATHHLADYSSEWV
jgi:broad specificity phosphatase PhoE